MNFLTFRELYLNLNNEVAELQKRNKILEKQQRFLGALPNENGHLKQRLLGQSNQSKLPSKSSELSTPTHQWSRGSAADARMLTSLRPLSALGGLRKPKYEVDLFPRG